MGRLTDMNARPENKLLRHYRVDISDSVGVLRNRNEFSVTEIPVLAENDKRLVLDNESFTIIDRQKSYSNPELDKPSIRLHANDSVYGNAIKYDLYTFREVRALTIKREIEKAVSKKFGFFMRGLNLDVISEKEVPGGATFN